MSKFPGKTALVTGPSSGIGLELAKLFAQAGYNLVLVSRDRYKLRSIAKTLHSQYKVHVAVIAQDLAEKGAAKKVVDHLQDIEIDILVNNAGSGAHGNFASVPLEKHQQTMNLNMVALTELTYLLLPQISKRKGGILNVASTAAYQPGPGMAVYYATKAYVLSLSEALSAELDVTVTALCPGPTKTDFPRAAGATETFLFRHSVMPAKKVAEAGFNGFMRGKRIVIPGVQNRALAFVARVSPRGIVLNTVKRLHQGARK